MAHHPWPHSPDENDPPIGVSIRPLGADQLPPLPPAPELIAPGLPEQTSRHTAVPAPPNGPTTSEPCPSGSPPSQPPPSSPVYWPDPSASPPPQLSSPPP